MHIYILHCHTAQNEQVNTLLLQFVARKSSSQSVGLKINGDEIEYLLYGDFSIFQNGRRRYL